MFLEVARELLGSDLHEGRRQPAVAARRR
jgi:hypothetical protein